MSFFGKLMFWKESEPEATGKFEDVSKDFGLGSKETGLGMGKEAFGDRTPGLAGTGELSPQGLGADIGSTQSFERPEEPAPLRSAPLERKPMYYQEVPPQGYGQQQYQRDFAKDMEIISAKLDSIKAMLDTINHRIDALERQQSRKGRMEW